MKIKFKAERNYIYNKEQNQRVVYFELLPCVAYRHFTGNFGYEYNLYLSWFVWCVSITLTKK